MIDLDDTRTAKIAEVISNKTCKKILSLIAEKEMSESEIVSALGIPANTVNYNIKKLMEAGLVEKARFMWSVKGKKMDYYKVSNRRIVISPKSMMRGVLPAVLITGILAAGIKMFFGIRGLNSVANSATQSLADTSEKAVSGNLGDIAIRAGGEVVNSICTSNSWAWFLLGAFGALFIVLLWNWRKR